MHQVKSCPTSEEMIPIALNEPFGFQCSNAVACFNACCRDLNQFLTPYDILQLKNFLGIHSAEFLAAYTTQHVGPETGLPVITLRPKAGGERECPFVTPAGCRIYPNRPSSCRIYPIARAVSRCRKTGRVTQHFAIIRESHCLGFRQDHRQSVSQWLQRQQLLVYLAHNDRFLDIIGLKNRQSPGPLDLGSRHLFQLALYDMDTFREHILHKGLLADWRLPTDTLQRLEADDVALLEIGHEFVARQVFGRQPVR